MKSVTELTWDVLQELLPVRFRCPFDTLLLYRGIVVLLAFLFLLSVALVFVFAPVLAIAMTAVMAMTAVLGCERP